MTVQFRIIIKGNNLSKLLKAMPSFLKEYRELKRQVTDGRGDFPFGKFYPCIEERSQKVALLPVIIFIKTCLSPVKYLKTNP